MKITGGQTLLADWSSFVQTWGTSAHSSLVEELARVRSGEPMILKRGIKVEEEIEPPQERRETNEPRIGERLMEAQILEDYLKNALVASFAGFSVHQEAPRTALTEAILSQSAKLAELSVRVSRIESVLNDVIKGIDVLRVQQPSFAVPINSLVPEPYEVLKPFTLVVKPDGEEFQACFFDANLYGTGDTEEEAVSDLKSVLIETFERLSELKDNKLGPAMLRQKRVVMAHIQKDNQA